MSGLLPPNPNPNPNPNPVGALINSAPPKRPVESAEQPPKRLRISVTPGSVSVNHIENRTVTPPTVALMPQQFLDKAQSLRNESLQSTVYEDYRRLQLEALKLIWYVFTKGNSIGKESARALGMLQREFEGNSDRSDLHAQLEITAEYLNYRVNFGFMFLDQKIKFAPDNIQYQYGIDYCLKLFLDLEAKGAIFNTVAIKRYREQLSDRLLMIAEKLKSDYMKSDAYKSGIKPPFKFVDDEMDIAFKIFKQLAGSSIEAKLELGRCYFEGLGVDQDYQEAVRLWTGDQLLLELADYELGKCYYDGKGVLQDREKAVDFWLGSENNKKAQNALMDHYLSVCSEEVSLLFKGILEPHSPENRLCFMRTFFYLSVDMQEKVIGFFQDAQSRDDLRALFQAWYDELNPPAPPGVHFFNEEGDDELKYQEMFIFFFEKAGLDLDAIKLRWIEILRDPDVRVVSRFCEFLSGFFEKSDMFGEFDEFTQEYVAADIRLSQQKETTSPYKIYADIKENRAVACEATQLPTETYRGVKMSLKPAFLKNELVGRQVYVRDLPKLDLHARLQSAVQSLIQRKNEPGFDDAVKIATGSSLDELEYQALGSSYLLNLLSYENKKPGELVPLIALKFMKIVENIFSKSAEREEGQVLSNREETLLRTLASIGGCIYGKREGVDAYYPSVAAEIPIRLNQPIEEMAQMKPGEEMVYEGITNAIETFITDSQSYFYKVLCGLRPGDEVNEAAHQTIHVKNMIGGEIGLEDRIIFDIHTPLMYELLLAKSKQEILDMFYQHFRPLSLIGLVRTYLNKVLALPKSTAYAHLSEAFQDVLDGCTDPWHIDTDKALVELTDEAVMKMLLKVAVLTSL